MTAVEFHPIETSLLKASEDLYIFIIVSLVENNLTIEEGDILAVSSKIFSYSENQIFDIEQFEDQVKNESEKYVPGKIVSLSRKFGWWVANAGIDKSNVPKGKAIKWPRNPQKSCDELRDKLCEHFGVTELGIIMVDSFCTPGRVGVVGGAIAVSGFIPVIDKRGEKDIYGEELKITQVNVADMLASGSNLTMGEAAEKIPLCLVRGYSAEFTNKKLDSISKMQIEPEDCLFNPIYHA
jgi:coenzyme F420-0:L-glutamate ligase